MRTILILLTAVVIVVAVFAVAIYGFGVENFLTHSFNRSAPILPAALVNRQVVTLREAENISQMYRSALEHQSAAVGADNKNEILTALVDQEIISDLLAKRGIEISQSEIDEYYKYVKSRFSSAPDSQISEIFGVSESDFIKAIVAPDLRRQKLRASVHAQNTSVKEYERAKKIQSLLDEGMDFAEAAKSYSEDSANKYIGGHLGFLSSDQINPWLESAAKSLAPSTTSEVIVSPDGYHILRHDNDQLQHIFIRGPDFDEYLDRQRKNYRIYTFIR